MVRNKKKKGRRDRGSEGLDTRGQKSDPIEIASSPDTWRNSRRLRLSALDLNYCRMNL